MMVTYTARNGSTPRIIAKTQSKRPRSQGSPPKASQNDKGPRSKVRTCELSSMAALRRTRCCLEHGFCFAGLRQYDCFEPVYASFSQGQETSKCIHQSQPRSEAFTRGRERMLVRSRPSICSLWLADFSRATISGSP